MKIPGFIARLLFPARCCGCDAVLPLKEDCICDDCRKLAVKPFTGRSACEICFLPADKCVCSERLVYDKNAFVFFNAGPPRKTLYKFKFHGRQDLADCYAKLLAEALEQRNMLDADYITAIPMSAKAVRKRGYNQAEVIARKLSEYTGIPCKQFIYKYFDGARQHDLDRTGRKGNILGAFEPYPELADEIEGRTIIVVDDIITGGSTMNEAAKTLKIFGADKVYSAAVAATAR